MKRLLRLGAIRMDAPFSMPESDESESEKAPGQEDENQHDHATDDHTEDPVSDETSATAEDEDAFEEADMPEIDAMDGIVAKPVQEAKKPAPKKPAVGRRNAK